ncbi:hypothetical protein GCM10010377_55200 [Streptomyces viridiviolaceus]|uniref:Ligand-binding SRPBCC domain-containing protein n=1 Tax=Streptomyces viridiviolaceus TaxID=68282 RepID=A0ABW2E394_9ACTN|nr:hypothetical protein [Streptomyces viridiviolaceus]GHB57106.1 hypothetical protein GCM10010377_55200 [Streptomyces viridiviolaceus]
MSAPSPVPASWDQVVRTSRLPGVDPQELWTNVTSMSGVNLELLPYMRMTLPRELRRDPSIRQVPLGSSLGKSWIFLGGLLPIDFDDIVIAEREEGRRFLERSTTSCTKVWQHERIIDEIPGGARLTDRLSYLLRPHMRPVRAPFRRAMGGLFTHRHRKVQQHYAEHARRAGREGDSRV